MITPTQNVFLIVILTLFCLFSIFPGVQLFRIWLNRHSMKSYQVLFLTLCFFWAFFRSVFWFAELMELSLFTPYIRLLIFWIPANIQFAMFSLLLIFFTRMLYKKQWYKYKSRCWIAFWVTNAILALIIALWYWIFGPDRTPFEKDVRKWLTFLRQAYALVLWTVLSILLVLVSYKLFRAMRKTKRKLMFHGQTIDNNKVLLLNVALSFIFILRAIFALLTAYVPSLSGFRVYSHLESIDIWAFLTIVAYEMVPTAVVLLFFRRIPSVSSKTLQYNVQHDHRDIEPINAIEAPSTPLVFSIVDQTGRKYGSYGTSMPNPAEEAAQANELLSETI